MLILFDQSIDLIINDHFIITFYNFLFCSICNIFNIYKIYYLFIRFVHNRDYEKFDIWNI